MPILIGNCFGVRSRRTRRTSLSFTISDAVTVVTLGIRHNS